MASLKKIAGYPESAVNWAMEKLSEEECSTLKETLGKMESFLGEKPQKQESKRKLPSKADLFEKHVLPIIIDGVRKLEMEEEKGKILEVNVGLTDLKASFQLMSLADLAILQKKIERMEFDVQTVDNFLKYYRGLIFYAVHQRCDPDAFSKWIYSQKISQATVYRYMAFCALIMRFPRLLVCDLNFSQIVSHKERIIASMGKEVNSKLAHQLSEDVEFYVGLDKISIKYSEPEIPHIKGLSFSEDWKSLDMYEETDTSCIGKTQTEGVLKIINEGDDMDRYMRSLSVEEKKDK